MDSPWRSPKVVGPGHSALDGPAGVGLGPDGPRGLCLPQPCCESALVELFGVGLEKATKMLRRLKHL